jgi:hypothetical protein
MSHRDNLNTSSRLSEQLICPITLTPKAPNDVTGYSFCGQMSIKLVKKHKFANRDGANWQKMINIHYLCDTKTLSYGRCKQN